MLQSAIVGKSNFEQSIEQIIKQCCKSNPLDKNTALKHHVNHFHKFPKPHPTPIPTPPSLEYKCNFF